jgi:hypothetical protein
MVFKARSQRMICAVARLSRPHASPRASLQADIHTARHPGKPLQEVHRFLLTDAFGQPIDDPVLRDKVVKLVRACGQTDGMHCLAWADSGQQVRSGLLG